MKRFFSKKWHGIPVGIVSAVLLVCMLAGSAFAAYTVWTHNSAEVTVPESIEVFTAADGYASLHGLPDIVWPGQGTCETYLIHNKGPIPIKVTVTMVEPAGTQYAGLSLVWSNATADILIGDDGQGGFYYPPNICTNTETTQILTYTFTIGKYQYFGNPPQSGGELYTPAKGDSAYVKVYAGFLVPESAAPGHFHITVTVSRG